MGHSKAWGWFAVIAWLGAAASAADWTGDRQEFLDTLRAKDAQFDNLSVEFRQTEATTYSELMEWMHESFLATKFGGEPPPRPDVSGIDMRQVDDIKLERLTVRGPETTLEATQETKSNGERIEGKLPTARTSTATGVQLRMDSIGDEQLFHYNTCPPDQFGLLVEDRMLDEFCCGIGYGRRILSIDGIQLSPEAAVVDATMRLWHTDVTKARLTIDKHFLVRKAELLATTSAGDETRFEISTEGTTDSAQGSELATSAHFRRIGVAVDGERKSLDNQVDDDYTTRLVSLQTNLDDETYAKLTVVDRSLATHQTRMDGPNTDTSTEETKIDIFATDAKKSRRSIFSEFAALSVGRGAAKKFTARLASAAGPSVADVEAALGAAGVKYRRDSVQVRDFKDDQLPALASLKAAPAWILVCAVDTDAQKVFVASDEKAEWRSFEQFAEVFAGELLQFVPSGEAGVRLWVPFETIDVGPLSAHAESECEVPLVNLSASVTVNLPKPQSSCGCTKVVSYPESLGPRSWGKLKIQAHPLNSSREDVFRQMIRFELDSKTDQDFSVTGKVFRRAEMVPQYLSLGEISEDKTEFKVESFIRTQAAGQTKVTAVSLDPGLAFEEAEADPWRGRVRLRWRFRPGQVPFEKYPAFASALLRVVYPQHDGSESTDLLPFVVHGKRLRELEVLPGELFFGRLKAGDHWTAEVRLRVRADAQPTWACVDEKSVAVKMSPDRMEVTFTAPDTVGYYKTNLLITASDSSFNLPISGYLEAR